jgi:alginate O-acetyltransferase complex protein AlgJ
MTATQHEYRLYEKGSREEEAELSLKTTAVSRPVAWLVCVALATILFSELAIQHVVEIRRNLAALKESGAKPSLLRLLPKCYDVVRLLPSFRRSAGQEGFWRWWNSLPPPSEIDAFADELSKDSCISNQVRPWVQEGLAYAGAANEKAYLGRNGWLFYRPGIDYCTGPAFLDARALAQRRANAKLEVQPDPRRAVLQFHRQLADRGIALVLMPVPDKATIHPEMFSDRYDGREAAAVQNPSYAEFVAEVQRAGVVVCDVANILVGREQTTFRPMYLATDTHWRPEAMEQAAAELARCIRRRVPLAPAGPDVCRREQTVCNLGDVAVMLKLRPEQRLFGREEAVIHPVTTAAGAPWSPQSGAEVLLLGDSFSNIFSLELMGWGAGAGLAEQLSFELQQPVDAILRNDDGAHATRAILSRELAQGQDRLAGKKVVVWQFAARELSAGDWKLLDMELKQAARPVNAATPGGGATVVSGVVAAKSAAPRAGTVTYADHIFTIDLENIQVLSGKLADHRIPVYLFSMRGQKNTPAYSCTVGQRVKLKLQPWAPEFEKKYGRLNRSLTEDLDLMTARPWWGEVAE